MNWIGIITTFLTVVNILICLLLIFVVLLQRPKTEGLGAALGGDTASNIFGAQTTNVLANLPRWLGGLFLGLCLVIAILGSIDPTRKSAVADFVTPKAAEKEAEAKRLEAEEAAKKAEDQLPGGKPGEADLEKKPAAVTDPVTPAPGAPPAPAPSQPAPGETPTPPAAQPPAPSVPADAPKAPPANTPSPAAQPEPAKPTPAPEAAPAPASTPTPAPDAKPAPEPAPAPAPEPAPSAGAPKPQ